MTQPAVVFVNSAGTTVKEAVLNGTAAPLNLSAAASATLVVSDTSCSAPAAATALVATFAAGANGLSVAGQYQVCSPEMMPLTAG